VAGPARARVDPWPEVQAGLQAGRLLSAYLFHGTESLLVDRAWRAAVAAAAPVGPRGFNRDDLHGPEVTPDAVANACRTPPMMAKRRLVTVRGAEGMKGDTKALARWLADPDPTAVLVMAAGRFGGDRGVAATARGAGEAPKGAGSALLRAFQQGAAVVAVEFRTPFENHLVPWVLEEVKGRGRRIAPDAARHLVDMCGQSLSKLAAEIDKALLYIGDRSELRLEDIEEIASDVRASTVGEWVDALLDGDLPGALLALDRAFLRDRDAALPLLAVAARAYRQFLALREDLDAGVPDAEAVGARTGRPQMTWKVAPQARRLATDEWRRGLLRMHQAEQAVKSSRLPQRLLLERLAMAECRARRPAARGR